MLCPRYALSGWEKHYRWRLKSQHTAAAPNIFGSDVIQRLYVGFSIDRTPDPWGTKMGDYIRIISAHVIFLDAGWWVAYIYSSVLQEKMSLIKFA